MGIEHRHLSTNTNQLGQKQGFMTDYVFRNTNTIHEILLIPCSALASANTFYSAISGLSFSQILQMADHPKSWVWYKQDLTHGFKPWYKHLLKYQCELAGSENKRPMHSSFLRGNCYYFFLGTKGKSKGKQTKLLPAWCAQLLNQYIPKSRHRVLIFT